MIDSNETQKAFRSAAFGSTARARLDAVKRAAIHRPEATRPKGVGNAQNSKPLWSYGPPRSAAYKSSVFGDPWSKPPATSAVKPEAIPKAAKNVNAKPRRPDGPSRPVAFKNADIGIPREKPTEIPVTSPNVSGDEHEVFPMCHEPVECDETGGKLTGRTAAPQSVSYERVSRTKSFTNIRHWKKLIRLF